MPNSNLIPKLSLVHHTAEDIAAKIVGYINFRDLDVEGYDDVRYVLQGANGAQFSEGHFCDGARSIIEWAPDTLRRERSHCWYASAADFVVLAGPHEGVDANDRLGTDITFRATQGNSTKILTGTVVGINTENGIFSSYIVRVHANQDFRGHDGSLLREGLAQEWIEGERPVGRARDYWFVLQDSIIPSQVQAAAVPSSSSPSANSRPTAPWAATGLFTTPQPEDDLLPLGTEVNFLGYSGHTMIVGYNFDSEERENLLSYILYNTTFVDQGIGHFGRRTEVTQEWLGSGPTQNTGDNNRNYWFATDAQFTTA